MSTLIRCDLCGQEIARIDKRPMWEVRLAIQKRGGDAFQRTGDACSPSCARKLAACFVDETAKHALGGED